MDLTPPHLLSRGYFPSEELPPAFNTLELGKRFRKIDQYLARISKDFMQAHKRSLYCKFSFPRRGFARRNFNIPNPLHFIILVKSIFKNRRSIERILSLSKYSIFLNDRLWKDWEEFKKERFIASQEYIFELKTDISRYFPTIYTHIIPWVVHGKQKAKSQQKNSRLWGNIVDMNVRNLQDGQTMGIPVGPHVSRIIAELIGCEIDRRLAKKFSRGTIQAFRWIDDYFFYFPEEQMGEEILKTLQGILYEFNLEINHEKTSIVKFPFGFDLEPEWIIALRAFKFRKYIIEQENDIKDFFSTALNYAKTLPGEPIMKYALKKLRNTKINKANWSYFESWLLKVMLYDPLTLPEILKIFLLNQTRIDRSKIKRAVEKLIELSVRKRNNFEVAWGLWIAKSLKITVDSNLIQQIFLSEDPVSILVALDLVNSKLTMKPLTKEIGDLSRSIDGASLYGDLWLLAYEGVLRGWLKPTDPDLLKHDEFFKILKANRISFYDDQKQTYFVSPARPRMRLAKGAKPIKISREQKIFFYRPGA